MILDTDSIKDADLKTAVERVLLADVELYIGTPAGDAAAGRAMHEATDIITAKRNSLRGRELTRHARHK